MNIILIYFLLALSLSIDAFFLSVSLSTSEIAKKEERVLSLLIGLFHFIMSLLGSLLGQMISKKVMINANILSAIIFLALAVESLFNQKKENNINILSLFKSILIAITVSLDSFNTGIAIGVSKNPKLLASTIFMIVSFLATTVGFFIGKKTNEKNERIGKIIGIIFLIIIAIKYLRGT